MNNRCNLKMIIKGKRTEEIFKSFFGSTFLIYKVLILKFNNVNSENEFEYMSLRVQQRAITTRIASINKSAKKTRAANLERELKLDEIPDITLLKKIGPTPNAVAVWKKFKQMYPKKLKFSRTCHTKFDINGMDEVRFIRLLGDAEETFHQDDIE